MSYASLAKRFLFNSGVASSLVEGFSDEDWRRSPSSDGGNNAHWTLGHLAVARRGLARKLGVELPEAEWEATFGMGVKPGTTEGYPAPSEFVEDLAAVGESLAGVLTDLSPEAGAADWGHTFPDGGTSVGDGAYFMHFHESYHLGQLGLLRRMCGHPGMI